MKTTVFAAIAAIALFTAAAAQAGEGNGEPFPFHAPNLAMSLGSSYAADLGSAAYPALTGRPAWFVAGGQLDAIPASSSEAEVETANALPRGAAEGTVAYAQGLSVRQYLAQREAALAQTAQAVDARGG